MENPACVYRWFFKGNPWVSYFSRNYTQTKSYIGNPKMVFDHFTSIWLNIGFHFFEGTVELTVTHTFFPTKDPGSHP